MVRISQRPIILIMAPISSMTKHLYGSCYKRHEFQLIIRSPKELVVDFAVHSGTGFETPQLLLGISPMFRINSPPLINSS